MGWSRFLGGDAGAFQGLARFDLPLALRCAADGAALYEVMPGEKRVRFCEAEHNSGDGSVVVCFLRTKKLVVWSKVTVGSRVRARKSNRERDGGQWTGPKRQFQWVATA